MMQFLGMFRHARTAHAQNLTKEMFVSLGRSAVSARDVYAQGGLIVMAAGEMRNRNDLTRALKLTYDASMSLIVARAYRMWGADYPRHIEGNAVTAVIDRTEDRMILSSDRAGAIGVYYAWRGRSAAFASHPALLLKMGAAGRMIERDGVCELFALGGGFSPGRTAFRDIRLLEGGCALVADVRGMRIKRYDSLIEHRDECGLFSIGDYVKTLPRKEYALLLSGGLSKAMAKDLREHAGAVLYHHRPEGENEEEAIGDFASDLNAPVELVCMPSDALIDMLSRCVQATGFPGTGIGDAFMYYLMKTAGAASLTPIAGGLGAFRRESAAQGNLLRFLRADVSEKIDAQGYVCDRLNEIADKMRLPMDAPGGEEWAERTAVCLSTAPGYLQRMRLLAGDAGTEFISPVADERLFAKMLSDVQGDISCLKIKTFAPEYARAIKQEAESLLDAGDQPILSLVDPRAIRREINNESADVSALSRLISINMFLYIYEAELSGF